MPIKNLDPFDDFLEKLDPNVNPYVQRLKDHTLKGDLPISYGTGLRKYVGKWRQEMARTGATLLVQGDQGGCASKEQEPPSSVPLILEVGCHQGQTLVHMAQSFPGYKFLGIDITFKRIVGTGEKIARLGLNNAFCALANAQKVSVLFAPGELDGVVVFFPDPWIKKARQSKNRLFNGSFVQEIKKALRPGGFVWFKTDQKIYAEEVFQVLVDAGFAVDPQVVYPPTMGRDFSSTFEKRFQEQNLPTYTLVAHSPVM